MNTWKALCGVSLLVLAALPAIAQNELPFHTEHLTDKILLVKYGSYYNELVVAVNTEMGIVIIDTGSTPSMTRRYRQAIEKEFPGKKFAYVINTHHHYDHTMGNQVFSEATIIGHDRCREEMISVGSDIHSFVESQAARIPEWETQLASLDPQSQQALGLREIIDIYKVMCADLEKEFVLTPPYITFNDQLNLDLGDITLKLVYFGEGKHTEDDILVYCPEEKALFTGDLFFSGEIRFSFSTYFEPARWITALDRVFSDGGDIKYVVTTHHGLMPVEQIKIWKRYLTEMWQEIHVAKEKGWNLPEVFNSLSVEKKFSYLSNFGLPTAQIQQQHRDNLFYMMNLVSETKSAMLEIQVALFSDGLQAAEDQYKQIEAAPEGKYYFSEIELNIFGYSLMNNNMFEEAVFIFKLCTEKFPESWNAYDSLGEAYMKKGDVDQAINSYEKSLELNPGNDNAKKELAKIREGKQD